MEKVIVVVPIYKSKCSENEELSLQQTVKVLGKYDIAIVCPLTLDISRYESVLGKKLIIERFSDHFFDGIAGYNDLCLSQEFYMRFDNYEYMLICHVDAWVFRDELEYWCKKGYDYIGAPLHHKGDIIGNGGFSLRRISKMIEVLDRSAVIWTWRWYILTFSIFHPRRIIRNFSKLLSKNNNVAFLLEKKTEVNEDVFFGERLQDTCLRLSVPSWQEAIRFSIEGYPEHFFNINNYTIPFGCHGQWKWWKEDTWKKVLEISQQQCKMRKHPTPF